MIRLQYSIPVTKNDNIEEILQRKFLAKDVKNIKIVKKSIDARKKEDIKFTYTIDFECSNEDILIAKKSAIKIEERIAENLNDYLSKFKVDKKYDCVVVGSGPAGLFCALTLAKMNQKVLIIERGKDVLNRQKDVDRFNSTLKLNTESNILFGEGGAGTFSDGKLNTNLHNELVRVVLGEFYNHGADKSVLYDYKPHVGTDVLTNVLKNIRKEITSLGGEYQFETKLTDLVIESNKIVKIQTNKGDIITNNLFLAIGHSARDTYQMLFNKGLKMEPKIFSIGVRIEHLRDNIDFAQYGKFSSILKGSAYKLSVDTKENKKLYTFCMCPGGYVVNATNEENMINVNGMSYSDRNNINSNSALLVNVEPNELNSSHPLAGIEFQRKYENLAYKISNSYLAPVQRFDDFLNNKVTSKIGDITPSIMSGYCLANLNECLPLNVCNALKDGINKMGNKISKFNHPDSILTGVEMRSTSPVRICRDEKYQSSIEGIYPIGEGAGFAGGIVSSAIDGIKCALTFLGLETKQKNRYDG